MNLKNILIVILVGFFAFSLSAQSDIERQVAEELDNQGVDQEEVKRRLIERGYDPDNIDPDNPTELLEIKRVTDEIIAEIQNEKTALLEVVEESSEIDAPSVIETAVSNPVAEVKTNKEETISNEPIKKAQIYGQQIYRDGAIRYYKENEFINPPSDYILGPGDKVTVSIWGKSEENFSQEISDGGYVKFSQIPRISLSGLKLSDAKELMKTKLFRYYPFREEDFELKVTSTRNINIFITGEVLNVGSYNISAVNPAVNALAAAGGPSDIGSVRNIKIVSNSGNKNLDLYKFLGNPQLSKGLFLNEGDYVFVPLHGKVVEVRGAIRRPYKYELLPEEKLSDLFDFAGGLKVDAFKKNIKVTRYQNDERVLINVDLSMPDQMKNFELMDGDVIEVLSIDDEIENIVEVEGALSNGGTFELKKGMRISELMKKIDLDDDAILEIAYLLRLNEDKKTVKWEVVNIEEALKSPNSPNDIVLQDGDKITIRGKSKFVTSREIKVRGAVKLEATYQMDQTGNLKVSDAIFLAGGLNPLATDFGYIIRKKQGTTKTEYIPIKVKELLADPTSDANLDLEPNDVVQIYEKDQYIDETFITIEGAVREPSTLKYDESLTLKDLLILSKGLNIDAAANNIDIFRLEFNDNNKTRTLIANASVDSEYNIIGNDIKLQPFDRIVVRNAPEFELPREVFILGEVKYPGKYYILNDNFTIADLVKEAGGLTDEAFAKGATLNRNENGLGYVVIDLEKAMKNPTSNANVILQLSDYIEIPKIKNLVTVEGAVNTSDALNKLDNNNSRINFVFDGNTSVKHYIERSGGFKKNSDKSTVAVIYPNGEVKRAKRILFFRKYPKVVPGSTIFVETKQAEVVGVDGKSEKIEWGKIFADSIGQASAILSLLLLVDRLD